MTTWATGTDMPLPSRLDRKPKRESRWRSTAHCNFVRGHACANCASRAAIEVAHVRIGSGAGMGQKPDDWRTVSLCHECHNGGGSLSQHRMGEPAFWEDYRRRTGETVEQLIQAFIAASPKRREIEAIQRERGA